LRRKIAVEVARASAAPPAASLEIQFLLGHVSVQTTERYLGCTQRISSAVNSRIEPKPGSVNSGRVTDDPRGRHECASNKIDALQPRIPPALHAAASERRGWTLGGHGRCPARGDYRESD
jgi:hypothetical protein